MPLHGKMQLFAILFLIITVSTEAKKRRTGKLRSKITEERNQMQGEFEFKRSNNPSDDKFRNPVPFGHIYKEGFEDPRSDYKQPIDRLELDTIYVKDGPAAREFMKKYPTKYQPIQYNRRPVELIPPVRSPDYDTNDQGVHGTPLEDNNNNKNDSMRSFWNIEGILTRNLQEPPKYRIGGGHMPKPIQSDEGSSFHDKSGYFSKKTYGLLADMDEQPTKYNFTTCEEFGARAKFHPNDIVNTDWVPFYIWSNELKGRVSVSRIHHFYFPTKAFVKKFKEDYSSMINKTLDWEQPKLILRHADMEVLLIAEGRSGLFESISYLNLPENMKNTPGLVKIPTMKIRMKIVDPYLAMMYCDIQYAVLLAVSGTEPNSATKCASEAATLKLKGRGFAVRRDLYMEEMEVRTKIEERVQKEQNKFITLENQMAAEISRFRR